MLRGRITRRRYVCAKKKCQHTMTTFEVCETEYFAQVNRAEARKREMEKAYYQLLQKYAGYTSGKLKKRLDDLLYYLHKFREEVI